PLFRSQHVHARAQPVADLVRRADGAHQPRPRVLRDAGPAGRISRGGLRERPPAGAGSVRMADFKIWMNGKVVPGEQAVLPVNSAAVFYATNCFEGRSEEHTLNSSHVSISYAVFCLKKKKKTK